MNISNALFLLLLIAGYAQAETSDDLQRYDIEIIIFEDANARYLNSEIWPHEEDLKDNLENQLEVNDETLSLTEKSDIELEPETIENPDLLTLDETNVTHFENIAPQILTEEYKKIDASYEQNVLFYASWRQTGLDETSAYDINIDELINNHELNIQVENVLQNKAEENSIPKNNITGYFKVVLARYLHFYSQLDYQRYQPVPDNIENKDEQENYLSTQAINKVDEFSDETDQSSSTSEQIVKEAFVKQIFPMKNHRRMRSKELHYIDHPLIGMLIQINPTEINPVDEDNIEKLEEVSPSSN